MKKKIKAFFKKHSSVKIKTKTLAKKIGANAPHSYAELKYVLHSLVDEGFLLKSGKRYFLNKVTTGKMTGVLSIIKRGAYGFVIIKNKRLNDIFIPEKFLGTAFHGDTVEINLFAKQRGKNIEGEVTKIIERNKTSFSGTLSKTKSFYFVIPDGKEIHRDIYVSKEFLAGAEDGDKVVVGEIEWDNPELNPEGKIIEVFGKAGSHNAEISSIAREYNFSTKFPEEVLLEAANISEKIPENEITQRLDLREELVITIDPEDAKDFDDAVSLKTINNGNYEIGIHIADVSFYVRENTKLYEEAYKRATSIYLVGEVIPMLPEKLSNKICSLVPNEDRLTYSVIVEITPQGKILSHKISKTIINSKRRYNYDEVQDILDSGKGDNYEVLFTLNKIARILRRNRMEKGSINFIRPEVKFELDENGKITNSFVKEVKASHELIEEYMLLANKIVAAEVNQNRNQDPVPFVYRIHDVPDKEKLAEFAEFARSLGYEFNTNAGDTSMQLRTLLEKAKGSAEEGVINEVAIRTMAKAIYSPQNIGHYGLGFTHYTHFTSPIRRFPDLIVHRIIFDFLNSNLNSEFNLKNLSAMCEHCSMMERNAIEAERLSVKIKQVEYLKEKVGQEFSGVISGVTNFGLFVQLNDILAEGLIHIRDLDDDYYIFDEKKYLLRGKASGKKYRLGDQIFVKIISVNEEKKETNFALLNQ